MQKLEDSIIEQSKNFSNPELPLTITFQSLVKLNRGKIETQQYLFDYFSYKGENL